MLTILTEEIRQQALITKMEMGISTPDQYGFFQTGINYKYNSGEMQIIWKMCEPHLQTVHLGQ